MRSRIEITNNIPVAPAKRAIEIKTGDIVLFRYTRNELSEKCIGRVHMSETGLCLAVLGTTVIHKLAVDTAHVGNEHTTKAGSVIEILGVCDVEIIIKDIRKYE